VGATIGSLKPLPNPNGSLKFKMSWRWLVAKWLIQHGFVDWQDVGEPPTLHWLQILQRFQPENA